MKWSQDDNQIKAIKKIIDLAKEEEYNLILSEDMYIIPSDIATP